MVDPGQSVLHEARLVHEHEGLGGVQRGDDPPQGVHLCTASRNTRVELHTNATLYLPFAAPYLYVGLATLI